mmetsp:Transcript_27371/g.63165  ORF Transcript_27371/g.63165 Transcript_27371/m.63165 type:complete len:446 (-) Transcript_27371:50-1387(-)
MARWRSRLALLLSICLPVDASRPFHQDSPTSWALRADAELGLALPGHSASLFEKHPETAAEKEEVAHELLPERLGLRTLCAFYTIIYGIVTSFYVFFFRIRDPEKSGCAPLMRSSALFFARHPHMTPMCTNAVLYALTDLYARFIEIPRVFDLRWTFSVAVVSPCFNGWLLVRLYDYADTKLGDQRDWVNLAKRVAIMQVLHLFCYLPLSCFLFPMLSEWIFRIIVDAMGTCGTAAILNMHKNLVLAFTASKATFLTAYMNSWQLYFFSNFLNFTFVHRWCPEFRSTWDTSLCLLWNMFDTTFHFVTGYEGGVCAIGHILLALSPAGVVALEAPLDCAVHSFWGLFVGFWVGLYLGIRWVLVTAFTTVAWVLGWILLQIWRVCRGIWIVIRTILWFIYDIVFVFPGAVWNVINGKPMFSGTEEQHGNETAVNGGNSSQPGNESSR